MTPQPHAVITAMPLTRRALLNALKKRGELTAEALAELLDITVSGARQQLNGLLRDGLVSFREVRGVPGRPKRVYRLTPAADALYPRAYAELTNELLEYVEDAEPELVQSLFEKRGRRRLARAVPRLEGKPFEDRVAELARILDEDGYLADYELQEDGSYVVTEHNCAVLGVAVRYGYACSSEIEFIREAIPDADIERISHMVAGQHNCSYRIVPATSAA